MKPLISVITPTYNHNKFIGACIESVLNQAYKDWEMIIIDDNSVDNSRRIIDGYVKRDSRIRAIYHDRNWGISSLDQTYNELLSEAKGEYVAILEGDDLWPRDYLFKQVSTITKRSAILSFSNWVVIDYKDYWIYARFYPQLINKLTRNNIWDYLSDLSFSILPSATVIQTSTLKKIGGFKKGVKYPFTDIPTFFRLALEGDFVYCSQAYSLYRKHKNSSWFDVARTKNAGLREEIHEEMLQFYKHNKTMFNARHINFNEKRFVSKQKIYLRKKKQIKKQNLLFHYFIFDDKASISAISSKNTNMRFKILAKILLFPGIRNFRNYFVKFTVCINLKKNLLKKLFTFSNRDGE